MPTVDDELRFHLEQKTRDLIARGLHPDQARAQALREFGDLADVRRLCESWEDARVRKIERRHYWAGWWQDVRHAGRSLRKDLGFTLTSLTILAFGIGSTTAVITIVQALLLRPLPIADQSRVVWIDNVAADAPAGVSSPTTGANTFLDWQHRSHAFDQLAAYISYFGYLGCNLTPDGADPERLGLVPITPNLFATLGVSPALGRTFTAEELEPADALITGNAPAAVILTDALWRRRFNRDPSIVGRTISLNGQPSRVVGVMPAWFDFAELFAPGAQVDLFTPLRLDDRAESMGNMLAVIGRLRPGVSPAAAQAELTTLWRAQPQAWNHQDGSRASLVHDHVASGIERPLIVLAAAVGLVLLMVCVNIATLLLSRGAARHKEMAVRAALGAGRLRLLRQLLTESLLLSGAGALLGLPLAFAAVRVVNNLRDSRLPLTSQVVIDARVLACVVVVTVATGLLFGMLPALRAIRGHGHTQMSLNDSSRGSSGGRDRTWTRHALVIAEIALACVLLVGAGLLLRSFVSLMETERGFKTERVTTARLDLGSSYGEPARLNSFVSEVRRQLAASPDTSAVGFTDALPLDRNRSWDVHPHGDRSRDEDANVAVVTPGYLEALGVKLIAGRLFDDTDRADGERVIVLGQTLATRLWPGADPLNHLVDVGKDTPRVIGVIADVRQTALDEPPGPQAYFPLSQNPIRSLDLVVRTAAEESASRQMLSTAVRSVDPAQPIGRVRTMNDLVDTAVSPRRFLLWLIGAFAAMALVLATLGIYGVVAHGVAQRRREIGIRVALGATAGEVQRAVIRQALTLALTGLTIGLIATYALTQIIVSLLYAVHATDPLTHAAVAALLLAIALLAGFIPARGAARIDPATALRAD